MPLPSLNDLRTQLKNFIHRRNTAPSKKTEILWATPETCHSIIAKKERGELLTRDEWQVFTYYVQQGSEYPRWHTTPQPEVLRAFRSVFELRHPRADGGHLEYYLRNLPSQVQPEFRPFPSTKEMVREAIIATFEALACNPDAYLWPFLPGRNLHVVLDFEPLIGGKERLNAVLLPHWDALCPVAVSALPTTENAPR
jgi:hypothetical protein